MHSLKAKINPYHLMKNSRPAFVKQQKPGTSNHFQQTPAAFLPCKVLAVNFFHASNLFIWQDARDLMNQSLGLKLWGWELNTQLVVHLKRWRITIPYHPVMLYFISPNSIWLIFLMVNVGKHTIHWWYGIAYRAYSSDFHPRYILWPSQVGIFSIGQLLTMHLKNPLPSFFRHVDTIKEPGLHIDAQISSQNIVPGIGQQVHPNTFARCKNKFYGFTAVVNLPPPHQTCHPTHTNEALLRVNPLLYLRKALFLSLCFWEVTLGGRSTGHQSSIPPWEGPDMLKGGFFQNFGAEIQPFRFQGYVYTHTIHGTGICIPTFNIFNRECRMINLPWPWMLWEMDAKNEYVFFACPLFRLA